MMEAAAVAGVVETVASRTCADATCTMLPLIRRYPALAALPRLALGSFPSPVERIDMRAWCDAAADTGGRSAASLPGELWIKRDDLDVPTHSPADSSAIAGGNKIRALEFLLADLAAGDEVLVSGGEGSTHVLVTAAVARALGARVSTVRWRHEMNPTARTVAARARSLCTEVHTTRTVPGALAKAWLIRRRRRVRWVPLGGSSPLGVLGHVNAGLELAEQIAAGELPAPSRLVVPLGTGGTAAGLALAMAIAGLDTVVVGARVVPRLAGNRRRVLALARATARSIERRTHAAVPRVRSDRVRVVHESYGGAYGRVLAGAHDAASRLAAHTGIRLDDSYSAKAFLVALDLAQRVPSDETTLFWLTFDHRGLVSER